MKVPPNVSPDIVPEWARCGTSSTAAGSRAKKDGRAVEQDRPDVLKQREDWFDSQLDLEPERLVFIDETWTATNMTRGHGRCARGERLRMGFPHGHRRTTTLVAGLRMTGMVAPMVLDGPINGDWFEAYVARVLVPELRPGDVVIIDNLSSHKRASVRELIEAAGATLRFLPLESHSDCKNISGTRMQAYANDCLTSRRQDVCKRV